MGVAITSGIIASIEASRAKSTPPTSPDGTTTPTGSPSLSTQDAAVPSRFIACVSRHESAKKLRRTFGDLGEIGQSVEVIVGDNLQAIKESQVALLW